jgi:hypothetical protein
MAYVPYFFPLIFLCAKNASRLDTIKKINLLKGVSMFVLDLA